LKKTIITLAVLSIVALIAITGFDKSETERLVFITVHSKNQATLVERLIETGRNASTSKLVLYETNLGTDEIAIASDSATNSNSKLFRATHVQNTFFGHAMSEYWRNISLVSEDGFAYLDEIAGYVPPASLPPTPEPADYITDYLDKQPTYNLSFNKDGFKDGRGTLLVDYGYYEGDDFVALTNTWTVGTLYSNDRTYLTVGNIGQKGEKGHYVDLDAHNLTKVEVFSNDGVLLHDFSPEIRFEKVIGPGERYEEATIACWTPHEDLSVRMIFD
jgi:hypothetical protein